MADLKTEKILCVGGSTLNLKTLEYFSEALIETQFLEEWAIIFTNHLYFKTKDVQAYRKKIRDDFRELDLVFVYEESRFPYTVEKGKIYVIPDSTSSTWMDVKFDVQDGIPILDSCPYDIDIRDQIFGTHWWQNTLDAAGNLRKYQPCIDKMMIEVAKCKLGKVAGIVLCGLEGDGAYGLQEIARHGGEIAVQEPLECGRKEGTSSMPNTCLSILENCRRISLESVESISDWLMDLLVDKDINA